MRDPVLTHHIQLTILRNMLTIPSIRYSDLKPAALEANLFMYHLSQLIKQGLVEKIDKRYQLTTVGKRFMDRADLTTMQIAIQPKIVIIIALRVGSAWLTIRRKYQPFVGCVGLPSGKLQYGETIDLAAERVLYEKSGLQEIGLKYRGTAAFRFYKDDQPVNHVISYIYSGLADVPANFIYETDAFSTQVETVDAIKGEKRLKGHELILRQLQAGISGFFLDEAYKSDY